MSRPAFLIAFALSLGMFANAQNPPRPRGLGPDSVSLFNGKELTGWNNVGEELWEISAKAIFNQGVT